MKNSTQSEPCLRYKVKVLVVFGIFFIAWLSVFLRLETLIENSEKNHSAIQKNSADISDNLDAITQTNDLLYNAEITVE